MYIHTFHERFDKNLKMIKFYLHKKIQITLMTDIYMYQMLVLYFQRQCFVSFFLNGWLFQFCLLIRNSMKMVHYLTVLYLERERERDPPSVPLSQKQELAV